MNYQRENRLWFEVLKDVRVEEEVEYEGEKGTLKQVSKKWELIKEGFLWELKREQGNMKMMCC